MAGIIVHQEQIENAERLLVLCPFGAIEIGENVVINSGCKMCKICIKQEPKIFEWVEDTDVGTETDLGKEIQLKKELWRGITVYIDHVDGEIHPVSLELIGKARSLAKEVQHPVYAVFIGYGIENKAKEILKYGVDEVFVYDQPELKDFRIEPYAACFEDYILKMKPSVVLVGGTTTGRSLAPRLAARFRTGLTADCTVLEIQKNTDLDQIRPAFGGNIMAHIHTPKHRPQFATVRYKIFDPPEKVTEVKGKITRCSLDSDKLLSGIKVLKIHKKEKSISIEDAEVIVVAGTAFKKKEDLELVYKLADRLNAMVAGTRPLIEKGWIDARNQIGLSGRTVRPKLIITCGVSGSVQFVAGMKGAEQIMAINIDSKAAIFQNAHYGIIGDVYEILPKLIEQIDRERSLVAQCQ